MAQHPCAKILRAIVRIDQLSGLVLRHGVDGEIAPSVILFEGYVGGRVDLEALVTARRLALSPRQRVFLVALRVQKDRKICPYRLKAERHHLLRCGTHNDVITVLSG